MQAREFQIPPLTTINFNVTIRILPSADGYIIKLNNSCSSNYIFSDGTPHLAIILRAIYTHRTIYTVY